MVHFLFPGDYLKPKLPDETFRKQAESLKLNGFIYSLCINNDGNFKIFPSVEGKQLVVYRGWMLSPQEYHQLIQAIKQQGGIPLHTVDEYLCAHHLPRWYDLIKDLTPETYIFPVEANLELELSRLNWDRYFIKDYVKSLKTSRGSVINKPSEITELLADMKKYRGVIEGGICVRKFEKFIVGSEVRYFVLFGVPFAPQGDFIPEVVQESAKRLKSKFFAVDVAKTINGVDRIVEIGDGQVSDLVGWSVDRFSQMWINYCKK